MKNNLRKIYLLGFLFSIPLALTSYINSSLLELYIRPSFVGLVYAFASIVAIIGMTKMPMILTKYTLRRSAIVLSILSFLSLFILAFTKNSILVISAFVIYNVINYFIVAILDILIEDASSEKHIGTLRGIYLSIINSSWVIAQFISGSIIAKNSFLGIYLFGSLFMLLVLILFITTLKNFVDPKYRKVEIMKTIKTFIKNKDLSTAYMLNFILNFFFSWMVIYLTLHLKDNLGFSWQEIGGVYAFMLLPFVLLSYPLGKISDKLGEKKILILGFLIGALATILIPLVNTHSVYLIAIILFFTRIGAATIEVMTESYFFKIVNKEDADEIAFFRNTRPMSFLIAPLLATILLLFLPSFAYLFYVLGAILFIGLFVTLRMKDIK